MIPNVLNAFKYVIISVNMKNDSEKMFQIKVVWLYERNLMRYFNFLFYIFI